MTKEAKNTAFEAFRVKFGDVSCTIVDAQYERSADGDGMVHDWLVLKGQVNDSKMTSTIRIELPAIVALAGYAVSQKATNVGGDASSELQKLADEFADGLEQIGDRLPKAVSAAWTAFAGTLRGDQTKKAS